MTKGGCVCIRPFLRRHVKKKYATKVAHRRAAGRGEIPCPIATD